MHAAAARAQLFLAQPATARSSRQLPPSQPFLRRPCIPQAGRDARTPCKELGRGAEECRCTPPHPTWEAPPPPGPHLEADSPRGSARGPLPRQLAQQQAGLGRWEPGLAAAEAGRDATDDAKPPSLRKPRPYGRRFSTMWPPAPPFRASHLFPYTTAREGRRAARGRAVHAHAGATLAASAPASVYSRSCSCGSNGGHGAQQRLQLGAEHFVDEREGLALVPEQVLPPPKGARRLEAPADTGVGGGSSGAEQGVRRRR